MEETMEEPFIPPIEGAMEPTNGVDNGVDSEEKEEWFF